MLIDKRFIYIKKRTPLQWITVFIVVMPLFLQALLQLFRFPSVIKYTIDVAWITAALSMIFVRRIRLNRKLVPFAVFITLFACYCLMVYLFRYQSILYFLWGFRNNFRYYFAFLAFVIFLDRDDIDAIFKLVDVLFVVNFFVSLYQFFVLNLKQDYCGGIFGAETGSNATTLLFFAIVSAKTLLCYMNGNEKVITCGVKCAAMLLVAALAELKFFFVTFVIILILASLLTRFSMKKLALVIISVVFISMAGSLYQMLFETELSISSLIEHFSYDHYATAEDVGRFSAIPKILESIHRDWFSRLFGLGLGNCDTASFAIFNTPFFQSHRHMNYLWFSSASWFLETGFVGLLSYLAFYVICYIKSKKLIKHTSGDLLYAQMAVIMSVLCILLTFYNSSLRTDIGFLPFFILALPFVANKENVCQKKGATYMPTNVVDI